MQHYRCYIVCTNETNAERIMATIAWCPTTFKIPQSSSQEATLAAAYDLTHALLRPRLASPVPLITDSVCTSLLKLAKILQNVVYRNLKSVQRETTTN